MAFDSFKPVLMLAQLILLARKNLVGSGFCNTQITVGLLKKGKKLTVNTIAQVSTSDTNEGAPMTYAGVDSTGTDVEITLDKTVAIKLSDRDSQEIEADRATLESAYASEMLYALADDVDQLIMGIHSEATNNYESSTTPWQWGTSASDWPVFCAAIHKALDDANVGNAQDQDKRRYMALPNVAVQGIRLYYGSRATNLGDQMHANGMVADNLFGFRIFQSPNCEVVSTTVHGLAGLTQASIALGLSISPNIEKLRLEGYWADGLRARVTAGVKCYKPLETLDLNLNTSLLA